MSNLLWWWRKYGINQYPDAKNILILFDAGGVNSYQLHTLNKLEHLNVQFIIPLKLDNRLITYSSLDNIEQTDNYFDFARRFIFYAEMVKDNNRNINLFLDGTLKEQEKADYLTRIKSGPESYSKSKFNEKVKTMGTLSTMHNTDLSPQELYCEYKNRGENERFFDHL